MNTILDHKEKITRTLKYIEKHIEGPLRLKNLAEVACLSDYHFHRSFFYYVGDTVSGYVRKRRLAKAATILKASDAKIIDVALAVGYETAEAFTKAFKRAYGVSPSVIRRHTKGIWKLWPRRVSAILLKPCRRNEPHPASGREAFLELSRLNRQIALQKMDSTWMSVFPNFQTIDGTEKRNPIPHCVTLGRVHYELIFPTSHAEFHIVNSRACAVLHDNDESIVFREAARIIPPIDDQHPQHLALLPIGMRSILCMAN